MFFINNWICIKHYKNQIHFLTFKLHFNPEGGLFPFEKTFFLLKEVFE